MFHHIKIILCASSFVGTCVHLHTFDHKEDEILNQIAAFHLTDDEAAIINNLPDQVSSIEEAMDIIVDRLKMVRTRIGKLPKDFHADVKGAFGDGTLEGTISAVQKQSVRMKMSTGTASFMNHTLQNLGRSSSQTLSSVYNDFSMFARLINADGMASELQHLIMSTSPPEPSFMFNWMGYHMEKNGMFPELMEFMKKMSMMYSGRVKPNGQEVLRLLNHTQTQLQGRAELQTSARSVQPSVPQPIHELPQMLPPPTMPIPQQILTAVAKGYYKETHNIFNNCFDFPCEPHAAVCFGLCLEQHLKKYGPVWEPGKFEDPDGFTEQVFTLGTYGPDWKMWTGFFNPNKENPSRKAGVKWAHQLDKPIEGQKFRNKTSYDAKLSLRESFLPVCVFHGDGTLNSPKLFSRHIAVLNMNKGKAGVGFKMQTGWRNKHDFYQVHYYPIKYEGPWKGPFKADIMLPRYKSDFRRKP